MTFSSYLANALKVRFSLPRLIANCGFVTWKLVFWVWLVWFSMLCQFGPLFVAVCCFEKVNPRPFLVQLWICLVALLSLQCRQFGFGGFVILDPCLLQFWVFAPSDRRCFYTTFDLPCCDFGLEPVAKSAWPCWAWSFVVAVFSFCLLELVVMVGEVAEQSWKIVHNGREVRPMVEGSSCMLRKSCGCRVAMLAWVVFCREVLRHVVNLSANGRSVWLRSTLVERDGRLSSQCGQFGFGRFASWALSCWSFGDLRPSDKSCFLYNFRFDLVQIWLTASCARLAIVGNSWWLILIWVLTTCSSLVRNFRLLLKNSFRYHRNLFRHPCSSDFRVIQIALRVFSTIKSSRFWIGFTDGSASWPRNSQPICNCIHFWRWL